MALDKNDKSLRATVGYEQRPARKATMGYGNALWNLRSQGKQPVQPAPDSFAGSPEPEASQPSQPEPDSAHNAEAAAIAATILSSESDPAAGSVGQAPTVLAESQPLSLADAPTLGQESVALADQPLLDSPASLPGTSRRSTVLPRLEVVGAEPKLVRQDRDRYEHIKRLGEGGVGEVIKAQDNDIGRTIAIKRLKADMRAPSVVVRFLEEIKTIGQLEHPNIVPIHDVGVDERGEYYFVMKYVDGETLEEVLERLAAGDRDTHLRYPFERRMEIFEGILEALAYAHANGVVHRDIKPANIMLGAYGEVVVMDWGIARQLRKGGPEPAELFPKQPDSVVEPAPSQPGRPQWFHTREGALIGTPAYMSPEQARGESVDERSDIYSVCVLLHELLGVRHYLADKRSLPEVLEGVQSQPVPFLPRISNPHQPLVPADLAWFVDKGVEKNPAKRYQSIGEMIDRLRRRKEGDIPIQCQVTFALRVANVLRTWIVRHPLLLTLAMVASVVLVIGLAWRAFR